MNTAPSWSRNTSVWWGIICIYHLEK